MNTITILIITFVVTSIVMYLILANPFSCKTREGLNGDGEGMGEDMLPKPGKKFRVSHADPGCGGKYLTNDNRGLTLQDDASTPDNKYPANQTFTFTNSNPSPSATPYSEGGVVKMESINGKSIEGYVKSYPYGEFTFRPGTGDNLLSVKVFTSPYNKDDKQCIVYSTRETKKNDSSTFFFVDVEQSDHSHGDDEPDEPTGTVIHNPQFGFDDDFGDDGDGSMLPGLGRKFLVAPVKSGEQLGFQAYMTYHKTGSPAGMSDFMTDGSFLGNTNDYPTKQTFVLAQVDREAD